MNKKLLALAIGAAAVMPVAANAAGPTLYGKMIVTLDSVDTEFHADTYGTAAPTLANPAPGSFTRDQWELNSNASRLGVKGDFALDVGDLKALYQAEYEIDVDSGGAAPLSQRNIFAGIQGDFGTLRAGKFDDPIKTSEGKVDQFNDLAGDIDSFIAGQNRPDNIIDYTSPKLADAFTVKVASIIAEGANVDGTAGAEDGLFDVPQVSVVFDKDAIYAALAYGKDTAMATQTADGFARGDIVRLVGQFRAEAFEVGALFQVASDNATGSSDEDTSIMLSGAANIDKVKLKLQYGVTEGDVTGAELTMLGVGADYKLAKASRAFVYMTKLEMEAGAASAENSVFGIGMEHNF